MILAGAVNLETFPGLTGSSKDRSPTPSGLSLIKRDYTWILESKLSVQHTLHLLGNPPATGVWILDKFQHPLPQRQNSIPLFPWKSIHFRDKKISFFVSFFFIKESKLKLRGFVIISFLKTIFRSLKMILYLKIEKPELAIFSLKKRGRKLISGNILFHLSTTLLSVSLSVSHYKKWEWNIYFL